MGLPDSHPSPAPDGADVASASSHHEHHDMTRSPDREPVAVVARRWIMKMGAVGPSTRRSPRLSHQPPFPPPIESQADESEANDEESESVHDVALYLSRDGTPENDDFPLEEPSTVLANRIIRAHDNPSPPPRDLAHPSINCAPGKDGQLSLAAISIPPSPFRPINLLEHLNRLSNPSLGPPHTPPAPTLGVRPHILKAGVIPSRDFISLESSPYITPVLMKNSLNEDAASADTTPSSSTQCAVDDLPSRSLQHSIVITSSIDLEVPCSTLVHFVDPSNSAIPSVSNESLQGPPPCSERQSRTSEPFSLDTKNKLSSPSKENNQDSLSAGTTARGVHGGREILSVDDRLPFSKQQQKSECNVTNAQKVNSHSLQGPDSLSLHSDSVLVRSGPSSTQTVVPMEPTRIEPVLTTPPRTPTPGVHPDFSRTSVQRPIVTPTPVRADGTRKLGSSTKSPLQVNDIYRTPARRVPIEIAHGISPSQSTVLLPTGSNQPRPGRLPGMRAPVFMRPALDGSSRSPAKRIPVAELVASPSTEHQARNSPTQHSLRARSISVEPPRLGVTLTRSRSVEPCVITPKHHNHGKTKDSIFPMFPIPPRVGTRLPFPLVPSQKSTSNLPPPIPEEHESSEASNIETDVTRSRGEQSNMLSQLRQPSANSRIPRIGNKPYVRPLKHEQPIVSAAMAASVRAPKASPFQHGCKNGTGDNNMGVSSVQPANDHHLVGSLKRKRGGEANALSNPLPVMIRQVLPGILNGKYTSKPAKLPPQVQAPSRPSPPKVSQPLKFRKVVDGMLSARYAPTKENLAQTELANSYSPPPSPLSELSSSSSHEESPDELHAPTGQSPTRSKSDTLKPLRTDSNTSVAKFDTETRSPLHQDANGDEPSSRLRRTSRTRKPAQHVFDVFSGNTSPRPPPTRRRLQPRTDGDYFMGMSATALKALTTSNTTRNQQTVALLATEVVRKEGLRPESPTIKARTVLQKQRDERDKRRRERAQKKTQMDDESLGSKDIEGLFESNDRVSLDTCSHHDENECAIPQKHRRGPGDEEDYKTPERPDCVIEPLGLERMERKDRPVKQVKWYRGLSTAVYLDEIDPKPKSQLKNVVARSCLAPTSKNLPLDSLGNLADVDKRPFPELVTEHIVVKKHLYDNDIEPEPIFTKMTRSKNKKSRS